MTEISKHVIKQINKNKKINIIKIFKGKYALCNIKLLFFGKNTKKATKWAKYWNNYEKSKSILIVYERKKIKNKVIGFKFIIGSKIGSSSVLGEEHKYKEGLEILKKFKY